MEFALIAALLLLVVCVVPVVWAWVFQSQSPAAARVRSRPRFFVAGALLAWSLFLLSQAFQMPLLGLIGATVLLTLMLGIVILFGGQIAEHR